MYVVIYTVRCVSILTKKNSWWGRRLMCHPVQQGSPTFYGRWAKKSKIFKFFSLQIFLMTFFDPHES